MNRPDRGSLWAEACRVALLFSLATLVFAYPLSLAPGSTVLPQGADTDLMLWIFGWDVHALTHRPWAFFSGNIYYPYPHTLAYAENLIGSAILTAPIIWLTGNLVLALNVAALASCVLCGAGAYVLGRRLGLGPAGAVVAGVIFAFAPPRFFRIGQLHLTTVQWMPFCLASLAAYLESGRKADLRWACAFFCLQAYTSGHGAVLTAVAILLLIVWRLALGEPPLPVKRLRDVGLPGLAFLLLTLLMFLPYRAVQQEMGLRRSLSESYLFSPTPDSFLASPSYADQWLTGLITSRPVLAQANALLFPGYLTLILAAIGIWAIDWRPRTAAEPVNWWMRTAWVIELLAVLTFVLALLVTLQGGVRLRYGATVLFSARQPVRLWIECAALIGARLLLLRRAPLNAAARMRRFGSLLPAWGAALRQQPLAFFALLTIVTVWLALGPAYGLYGWVYDWPGFSFIRVPSRFTILALLALALLAGGGAERLAARFPRVKPTAVAAMLAALLLAEFAAFPLTTIAYATDIPPIDRWIAGQPASAVIAEVPVEERLQGTYMVHSTAHWRRTVHGYSGMRPPLHSALFDDMTHFPDLRSVKTLAGLGVTHIVVHTNLYPEGEWRRVEGAIEGFGEWLTLEHVEGDGRVYRLHAPEDGQ